MKTFAKLDSNGQVLDLVVVADADATTVEQGVAFLYSITRHLRWVLVPEGPSTKYRVSVGSFYREDLAGFVDPQPFPSWVLDEVTCEWEAPIPMPSDNVYYIWDEESTSWIAQPPPDE